MKEATSKMITVTLIVSAITGAFCTSIGVFVGAMLDFAPRKSKLTEKQVVLITAASTSGLCALLWLWFGGFGSIASLCGSALIYFCFWKRQIK